MLDFLAAIIPVFAIGFIIGVVWADRDNEKLYSSKDYDKHPYDEDWI